MFIFAWKIEKRFDNNYKFIDLFNSYIANNRSNLFGESKMNCPENLICIISNALRVRKACVTVFSNYKQILSSNVRVYSLICQTSNSIDIGQNQEHSLKVT